MGPIRNAAYVLRQSAGNDGLIARSSGVIERQVKHLARMIDDLLEISRITRGKFHLQRERLDLCALAQTVADDNRPALEKAGLRLSVDLPSDPVWIKADSTRITQVMENLLSNAAKFTDPGGEVSLSVSVLDSCHSRIEVRDTGIGIEPQLLNELFEPFSQADRSLNRSRGGLGLGLAIVRGIVSLHDGEIRVASGGVGKGSSFVIEIPIDVSEEEEHSAAVISPMGRPGRRILIIEDNVDAAESLSLMLELNGHRVSAENTGQRGINRAAELKPEIVICDIGLPDLSGYDVCRTMRSNPILSKTRFIALTGYGQAQDRQRARDSGFHLHLTKPVDLTVLEAAISQAELTTTEAV